MHDTTAVFHDEVQSWVARPSFWEGWESPTLPNPKAGPPALTRRARMGHPPKHEDYFSIKNRNSLLGLSASRSHSFVHRMSAMTFFL